MTVSSNALPLEYEGDGVNTTYAVNWRVYYADDIAVYRVVSGVATLLTVNVDYSVSDLGKSSAKVTHPLSGDPLAIGSKLRIFNQPQTTQKTKLDGVTRYDAAGIEEALNRLTRMVQALDARTLQLIGGALSTGIKFPDPAAEQILGWTAVAPFVLRNYSQSEIVAGGGGGAGGTFDISALPRLTGSPANDDDVPLRDTSVAADRKVATSLLMGTEVGDCQYKLAANQALTADTDATMNLTTAISDNLKLGTWSGATKKYTSTGVARLLVVAWAGTTTLGEGESLSVKIRKQGAGHEVIRTDKNESDNTPRAGRTPPAIGLVTLTAGQTVEAVALCTFGRNLDSTEGACGIIIVELG